MDKKLDRCSSSQDKTKRENGEQGKQIRQENPFSFFSFLLFRRFPLFFYSRSGHDNSGRSDTGRGNRSPQAKSNERIITDRVARGSITSSI